MMCASSPWFASRTTSPAANAPSNTSRPRRLAIHTRSTTSNTAMRMGSCELVSSVLSINNAMRWGVGRSASAAAPVASTTKATSKIDVPNGLLPESSNVIATIGRNSPAPPIARMNDPNLVWSSWLSSSIGSRGSERGRRERERNQQRREREAGDDERGRESEPDRYPDEPADGRQHDRLAADRAMLIS